MNDLDRLINDLEKAPAAVRKDTEKVVSKGALNVKQATQKRWRGLSNAPRLARAVTYDLHTAGDVVSAEIGPDKDKEKMQGALGNLIEYGSVNNAPRPAAPRSSSEEQIPFESTGTYGSF